MNFIKKLYSGRIGSLAYFVGLLISGGGLWLISQGLEIINHNIFTGNTFISIIEIILSLISLLFTLSLFIRRLHDLNKSGWLFLLMFVPLANLILEVILLLKPGSHEANKFGIPSRGGKFIFEELFGL